MREKEREKNNTRSPLMFSSSANARSSSADTLVLRLPYAGYLPFPAPPSLPPLIASADPVRPASTRLPPPPPKLPPLISSADALVYCLSSWDKIGKY